MSEVLEGYERQYCELSANLLHKCTSAGALDGEQKKKKVYEITSGLEDAEALAGVKATLLAKLRGYKNDINGLKHELTRITTANLNVAARDGLLESGMADTMMASADQRRRY